ncbi:protein S100-P-like [Micropterus salmoides]|uniref:protein S100-P-like n=1 Tax=Micropterus salmoides TaxID=27706 RepID=UPI0018EE0B06|nr:protein S100-P-like [Micropterus salmoides]
MHVYYHRSQPHFSEGIKRLASLIFHFQHIYCSVDLCWSSIFFFTVLTTSQAATMTQIETAMAILMRTFDTYAASEGSKDTLSKAEVKILLEKELPGLLKAAKNQEEVDKLLKSLDFNGDSEVDFSEFVVLVAALTCACHDRCPKK